MRALFLAANIKCEFQVRALGDSDLLDIDNVEGPEQGATQALGGHREASCARHDGQVEMKPAVEQGSIFWIQLSGLQPTNVDAAPQQQWSRVHKATLDVSLLALLPFDFQSVPSQSIAIMKINPIRR